VVVIREDFRIHNCGSQTIRDLVYVHNHSSQMFEKMKEHARWFFKIFELDQRFFDSDCFKQAQPEPMVV